MFNGNQNKFVDSSETLNEIKLQQIELQKERQKFYDERNSYRRLIRNRSREEELNNIICEVVKSGSLPSLDYKQRNYISNDQDMLISLNDLHYGAYVHNFWNNYDTNICKEYFSQYIDDIINFQDLHNCENAIVWENGDAVNGLIHQSIRIENRENVMQQVMEVSELISDFLAEISKHFKSVMFVSVAGNHSRLDTKDDSPKDERVDDLVEWYLKARLQNIENIKIGYQNQLDETMYLMNIRGLNYLGVHGDFDQNNGQVLKAVAMIQTPVYAVLTGHKHHNKIDETQGIKVIMAGSFLGTNDYCIQKRIYGKPEQLLCICDKNGMNDYHEVVFN